ncbi:MAG: outer membrane protein assembly factor BamE [Gammaproteobacteria bacterium]|nr:outer membrane protein assembly factor BamE [Gammaproteobacteria bacterium]
MQISRLLCTIFAIVALQGCVYRMDIPQGNQINPEKLAQLKTGMTRSQVEFLLGSAAINDRHHANQAHYVYYKYEGKVQTSTVKSMILTYENDILIDIKGEL